MLPDEEESGRIAFAQGEDSPITESIGFRLGWIEAWKYHDNRLDRNGHTRTIPPHTCPQDASKVCVCCHSCESVCRVRGLVIKAYQLARSIYDRRPWRNW